MAIEAIHQDDSALFTITVKDSAGSAVDITGTTVQCRAARLGIRLDADSVSITDAANGVVTAFFETDRLKEGTWTLQCRVIDGSNVNTVVYENFEVLGSKYDQAE